MSTLKTAVLAAAFALCAVPGAFAAGSSLQLIIGGEAYDGPPKFEVTFDGKVLGEGAVNAAIDTATAGRFADAEDKTPYVQAFAFDIPEDVFKPGGEVRVRLVNEAYGGDGSNRDRNLYLAAVAVNGSVENIGARRLQTVLEKVMEEISFTAADRSGETIAIDAAYVQERIGGLAQNADLSKFIL